MKLIVGIDFGTSTTVVRYKVEGTDAIYSVKDADGVHDIIPTALFKYSVEEDAYAFGYEAINMAHNDMEGEFVSNFKMGLLDADENTRLQKKAYIEKFLSLIHERFVQETVKYVGYDIDLYISYPAKWSDEFVTFMKDAFRKAGFSGNIYGKNEPTAATYNMLFKHLDGLQAGKLIEADRPVHVFMLDMGAGTTDIVIFRLTVDSQGKIGIDNLLSYPTIDNPYLCGGREIDGLLMEYIYSSVKKLSGVDLLPNIFLLSDAKAWKDNIVSTQLKKKMVLKLPPTLMSTLRIDDRFKDTISTFSLNQEQFEQATTSHWEKLYELISSAICFYKQKYQIGAEDIDLLYLTGGHSQWYTVPNLFNGIGVNGTTGRDGMTSQGGVKALNFKKLKEDSWRMFSDALPHECVAVGLCLQDSIMNLKSEIKSVSANNIWLQLEINDKKSEVVKVADQAQTLPSYFDDFTISLGKIAMIPDEKKPFAGYVKLFSGDTLETAQCSTFEILIAFGTVKFFFTNSFLVDISCDISVEADNTIGITGYVSFDPQSIVFSKEYIKFSNKTGDERHGVDQKEYVDVILTQACADKAALVNEIMSVNGRQTSNSAKELVELGYGTVVSGVSRKTGNEITERLVNLGAQIKLDKINFSNQ